MSSTKISSTLNALRRLYHPRYDVDLRTGFFVLFTIILMGTTYYFNDVMANVASYRSPNNHVVAPLSDLAFDVLPSIDALWLTDLFDYLLLVPVLLYVLLFTRTPLLILCKTFIAMSLVELGRITTVAITSYPDPRLDCIRYTDPDPFTGISLHRCGDSMYSGHTAIYVMSALVPTTYPLHPSLAVTLALRTFIWGMAILGTLMVLMNRSHYSMDVLVAYYVTIGAWYSTLWWWRMWEKDGVGRLCGWDRLRRPRGVNWVGPEGEIWWREERKGKKEEEGEDRIHRMDIEDGGYQ